MCESYNGHTNYQTWAVGLWLDNDEMLELAEDAKDEDYPVSVLSTQIKELVEELNPLLDNASMFTYLLEYTLGGVDWYELAQGYLEEVGQE